VAEGFVGDAFDLEAAIRIQRAEMSRDQDRPYRLRVRRM
jgi:hypothetical protein